MNSQARSLLMLDENYELLSLDAMRIGDSVRGVWINVLVIFIVFIKILILLFSPLLIPEKLYLKKFTATDLHLSPLHGIFLICYIVLALDSLVYGALTKAFQEKFKMVLRDCFRDMKEKSKLGVCNWAMNLALVPFDTLGILGFILVVPFWIILSPLFSVVFIFYFIPTINLTLRLLIQLFICLCPESFTIRCKIFKQADFRQKGNLFKKDLFLQFVVILGVIVSFWSLTFLAMECISFFVEVGVYTLIGIIINADVTVRYIFVIFLLVLYVRDCFGKVYKKYLNFHKVITTTPF
ncbi:uncharacterized protein LOC126828078 [Patella vulgata]|uniref:uncharacterized protein LOC126828078 n=1 Tax=Patella vulgata TaxID=6465 RepID=UPI0024A91EDE|nr:uncharacterized protein LOC126828078 [Patella vulgata]